EVKNKQKKELLFAVTTPASPRTPSTLGQTSRSKKAKPTTSKKVGTSAKNGVAATRPTATTVGDMMNDCKIAQLFLESAEADYQVAQEALANDPSNVQLEVDSRDLAQRIDQVKSIIAAINSAITKYRVID